MNKLILENTKKSGYSNSFVESYMKKNDLLPKEFRFRRNALEKLLKQFNKKISDFIKDTYTEKEQKNKSAQISKILNPKKNAPKYFTENDLANDLAHWFNNFVDLDEVIAPNYFVGESAQIDCIGQFYGNGQVGLHKKSDRHKTKIIWFGYIEPLSNGRFNILDKSHSTGKTIAKLAENIQLSWTAEIKASYYPTVYNG